jgi:hypothetical protein
MEIGHWKSPLTEKLQELQDKGYSLNFSVSDKGLLVSNDQKFSPEEVQVVEHFRFEGESNPSDMSILYALETNDGKKGTLVNSYGTYGDEKIDAFINRIGR